MTTIFIDYRSGLVLSDSRTTTSKTITFFGLFEKEKILSQTVSDHKCLYIHDRVFAGAGNVASIDKMINHLSFGTELNLTPEDSFTGALVDKSWMVLWECRKGKISKRFILNWGNLRVSFGTGADHLKHCISAPTHEGYDAHMLIEEVGKVHLFDPSSDSNINIHYI